MHEPFAKNGYDSGHGTSVVVFRLPIELCKPTGLEPVGFNGIQS